MIRKMNQADLPQVMDIWLQTNVEAHRFIDEQYWHSNAPMVQDILPQAEVYVYTHKEQITGFVGLDKGYIAGIFVDASMQSQGVGKALLGKAKELYPKLSLQVYKKNQGAVKFYLREGFTIEKTQVDPNTKEEEYFMIFTK